MNRSLLALASAPLLPALATVALVSTSSPTRTAVSSVLTPQTVTRPVSLVAPRATTTAAISNAALANAVQIAPPPFNGFRKCSTRHLGKLFDTNLSPSAQVGIGGTDLGVSFERDGKLLFLFGDTWSPGWVPGMSGTPDQNLDSVAWTDAQQLPGRVIAHPTVNAASPVRATISPVFRPGWLQNLLPPQPIAPPTLPKLTWFTNPDGHFTELALPGIDTLGMNVPLDGVVDGPLTHVFSNTGWSDQTKRHSSLVLTQYYGSDFACPWVEFVVPSDKFLNVSCVQNGSWVLIYGSGVYRQSAVYLAATQLSTIANHDSWIYFAGNDQSGQPIWTSGESNAVPVVDESSVGELSVRKHPALGCWLMTYNCANPRGIVLRWSSQPQGPWSDRIIIMDPGTEGYGVFMHQEADVVGFDDGLSEHGRENEWGGEYGPYLIPQWFTEDAPGIHTIFWVCSSWNPYRVHLMKTVLAEPWAQDPAPSSAGTGLPPARLVNGDFSAWNLSGWESSGDSFALFMGPDGLPRLTTYGALGDATVGALWQDFTVDAATSELDFSVHGGDACVQLLDANGNVVRSTWGRRQNSPETPVRWNLVEYRGEKMTLRVLDDLTQPWGFVGCSGFSFH